MKSTITGPRQYTVLEAAEYLQLHPQTVYDLVRGRLIRYRRKGPRMGRLFFLEDDLQDYLAGTSTWRARP